MITLPGLVDVHVHMRQPGAEHKEDWASGTAAALAGGITTVLAMPNTTPALVDATTFADTLAIAEANARCDFGLFVGATAGNAGDAWQLAERSVGLKMYLNDTFGDLRLDDIDVWAAHLSSWPARVPVVAHAESRTAAAIILAAHLAERPIHLCHVSTRGEIELIARAKGAGMAVTCEVSPHHMFLTEKDAPLLGRGRAAVKPPLATEDDQAALWEYLEVIDCFATDHAPHLLSEKDAESPPPGFPGLETALPLLIDAVASEKLTLEDVTERMHTNPHRIFDLPKDPTAKVEIDPDATWTVAGVEMFSKAGWTPFEGRRVTGRVERVTLRGIEVYSGGIIKAEPGSGRNVRTEEP